METREKLAESALKARESAYARYSGFAVGAAVLTAEGDVFTGCNIENASYSVTNCAERTALFKAVSEGARQIRMVAVAGGKEGEAAHEFCPPCGVCRQALAEFCAPDTEILLVKEGGMEIRTMEELLPAAFRADALD